MNKIFNLALALVLFCTSANAVGLEIPTSTKKFFPTNVGEKNRANSGTDYYVDLHGDDIKMPIDGLKVFTSNSDLLNMPESQFYALKSKEFTEYGMPLAASEIEACLVNGEYEWMQNKTIVSRFGSAPINYAIYKSAGVIDVDDHYDPEEWVLVLTPKKYPGLYAPMIKNGCINYQGGIFYEPTGDNDQDYSLPQSGSDATATATATVGDVDVTVYTGETEDEGGNTFIENYYEAGDAASGYGDYGYQPDPSLYWSLGASWSQCGGWSFNGGLSNSPYGVGGYNSGYGYGGYGGGGYNNCGGGGFYDYSTTNNYYGGFYNHSFNNNNNNTNSGNTTVNWYQWYITHHDPPTTTDDGGIDPPPTNTAGVTGPIIEVPGDPLPTNTAGLGKQANPNGGIPTGFKTDWKKSTPDEQVMFASAETKTDETKVKSEETVKIDGQSKESQNVNTEANKGQIKENAEKQFHKDQQTKNPSAQKPSTEDKKPTEKQFEIKKKPEAKKDTNNDKANTEQSVKQKSESQKQQDKGEEESRNRNSNVDKDYDKSAKTYHANKSTEVKKEVKQPVKKSTTVKGDSAKNKPNSSAKKSSGKSYKANSGKQGNGQNYKTRDSGSHSSPKRRGRS